MRRFAFAGLALAALALAAIAPPSIHAEMWCADPLWVHEWGVQVFGPGGGERTAGPSLPSWFHSGTGAANAAGPPVRGMPVDGGERALPVVHFYAPRNWRPAPVAFEVGFANGAATRWYPQVDGRRAASDANGAAARAARQRLLAARAARSDPALRPLLGRDPTRQLAWDHLTLADAAARPAHRAGEPWVRQARGFSDALWVNGAAESERFLFYEGRTTESPAVRITRGPTYGPGRRHYLLHNDASHAIHDVFFVHREAGRTHVFVAPQIPAGRSAGFLLSEHRVPNGSLAARTRGALRERLVDTAQPAPPANYSWSLDHCVMQRDPALPTEAASGHRLYAHEVDLVLDVWEARFFSAPGTTIVYREDTGYLDAQMPVSVYTDMYHHVDLRRLGLALMERVVLP